jgi:hypothetical protein
MNTMMATTPTLPDQAGELGYELGRYTIPGTERVLCGQRVNGEAIVIDAPTANQGRVYLVERDVELDGYPALKALIADYIQTATATGRIPMAPSAPVDIGTRGGNLSGALR